MTHKMALRAPHGPVLGQIAGSATAELSRDINRNIRLGYCNQIIRPGN